MSMVVSGGAYDGSSWSAMYDPSEKYQDMVSEQYYAMMGICDGQANGPLDMNPKDALLLFDKASDKLVYAEALTVSWNDALHRIRTQIDVLPLKKDGERQLPDIGFSEKSESEFSL